MRRIAVIALVILAACGSSSSHVLHGTMTILNTDNVFTDPSIASGKACVGTNGYDDLAGGAQVKVTNEKGTLIGSSALGLGQVDSSGHCVFPYRVKNIPGANFYTVEVSHRGGLTHSAKELDDLKWSLDFTLGS